MWSQSDAPGPVTLQKGGLVNPVLAQSNPHRGASELLIDGMHDANDLARACNLPQNKANLTDYEQRRGIMLAPLASQPPGATAGLQVAIGRSI